MPEGRYWLPRGAYCDAGRPFAIGPEISTVEHLHREIKAARHKFPGNRFLLAALTEEVGELAQAMLQKRSVSDIQREAIQVACVALRIYEEGDRSFADLSDQEALP